MSVSVRSPSKVILFGEHAVVYGYKAVAAAISLYTNVQISLKNSPEEVLFYDIPSQYKSKNDSISLGEISALKERFHFNRISFPNYFLSSALQPQPFPSELINYFNENGYNCAICCLVTALIPHNFHNKQINISITSELPVGGGIHTFDIMFYVRSWFKCIIFSGTYSFFNFYF